MVDAWRTRRIYSMMIRRCFKILVKIPYFVATVAMDFYYNCIQYRVSFAQKMVAGRVRGPLRGPRPVRPARRAACLPELYSTVRTVTESQFTSINCYSECNKQVAAIYRLVIVLMIPNILTTTEFPIIRSNVKNRILYFFSRVTYNFFFFNCCRCYHHLKFYYILLCFLIRSCNTLIY